MRRNAARLRRSRATPKSRVSLMVVHYLRAVILLEQGDPEQARASLQRAIYLHPGYGS